VGSDKGATLSDSLRMRRKHWFNVTKLAERQSVGRRACI